MSTQECVLPPASSANHTTQILPPFDDSTLSRSHDNMNSLDKQRTIDALAILLIILSAWLLSLIVLTPLWRWLAIRIRRHMDGPKGAFRRSSDRAQCGHQACLGTKD